MIDSQYKVHPNVTDKHPFSSFSAKDNIPQELSNAKLFSNLQFYLKFTLVMLLLIVSSTSAICLSILYYKTSKTLTSHDSFI